MGLSAVPILSDNPLVRAAARVPATVQRKLLVAFAIVVALLVTVGVLGLNVLSQSNTRVDALGQLPQRLAAYQQLLVDTGKLGGFMTERDFVVGCLPPEPTHCTATPYTDGVPALNRTDGEITATLDLMAPLTNVTELGFVLPADENAIFAAIRSEYISLAPAMMQLIVGDDHGSYVNNQPQSDQLSDGYGHGLYPNAKQLVILTSSV